MNLDALRLQYESMTDEALLEIDHKELVETARQILNAELKRRGIELEPEVEDTGMSEAEVEELTAELSAGGKPDWVDEGVVVYGESVGRGNQPRLRQAIAVLVRAEIPFTTNVTQQVHPTMGAIAECELLVPPHQQLQALSVLDKDLFNALQEADWRAHFDTMTDDELLALDEDALVGGLRDRAARMIRAWEDELLKRGLAELEQ